MTSLRNEGREKFMTTMRNKSLSPTNGNYSSCSIMYLSFAKGVIMVAIRTWIYLALVVNPHHVNTVKFHLRASAVTFKSKQTNNPVTFFFFFLNSSFSSKPTTEPYLNYSLSTFSEWKIILSPATILLTVDDLYPRKDVTLKAVCAVFCFSFT